MSFSLSTGGQSASVSVIPHYQSKFIVSEHETWHVCGFTYTTSFPNPKNIFTLTGYEESVSF